MIALIKSHDRPPLPYGRGSLETILTLHSPPPLRISVINRKSKKAGTPMEFAGCYTALVTPFTESGQVDLARFREHIQFQKDGGVSGIVPCGTTGESPTLLPQEWERVVTAAVETTRPLGLTVIAGTGSNSTHHAVEMQRFAARAGAHAGLSVNPYYNKPTQEGLYRHFMEVADAADLPVVLYNIPGRTGVALKPETIARLSRHPNIQAVKEATGSMDSASEIAASCEITILSGDDSMTLPFCAVGATGVVSVVSNILPKRVQSLCDACNGNEWVAARAIHLALFEVCRGLLSLETNPIPIKAAMKLLGRDTGVLRLPMTAASEETFTRVRELLVKLDMI